MVLAFLLLVPLGMGFWSLALGQDSNWDLRNYHWFNAHAFLTGRTGQDVAPGQIASFYNPTLDLPFYWLAQQLPARTVGFIMGWVQGLNLIPLYGLAWVLLPLADPARRAAAAGALALVGLLGAGQLGLLGTTFYDNVISLPVLAAAWIVAARADLVFRGPRKPAFALVALAGLLVGSAVGLKQPTLPYAVGFCFAFLLVAGGFWRRVFLSFFFGIGVIAGMLAFGGHWMWYLWTEYGNPLFPYFNHVFNSPFAAPDNYRDAKFIPESLGEALAFPFLWVMDPTQVGEIAFTDLRVPVLYAVLLATPLVLLAGRRWAVARPDPGSPPAVPRPAALYLLAAGGLSYLVWLKLFSIYRYLVPLEMLAPLLLVAAIGLWPVARRLRVGLVLALLALVALTARPGNWSRIGWTERFVEIQAPTLADPDNTLVVMTGFAPTAFLLTGFPETVRALRLHSYFAHPDQGDTGLNRMMADRIAAHTGPIELLVAPWELWTIGNILHRYALTADPAACRPVTSNLDEPMKLCPVTRIPGAVPQLGPVP